MDTIDIGNEQVKYYLSAYKLGHQPQRFSNLFSDCKTIAYIPNAIDFTGAYASKVKTHISDDVGSLKLLGLQVAILDLNNHFEKDQKELDDYVNSFSGLWVSGGNVFVLRQAMKLSGIDTIIKKKSAENKFVYGGYSAGCCVLSDSLKPYQMVDDATDLPYPRQKEVIWNGLGLIDFAFMPHFQSDHPESGRIDAEINYCKNNNIAYKAVSDGDVLMF